ncbi:MAG: ROK family transcriptional regulator, partial [Bacillota bacterium]
MSRLALRGNQELVRKMNESLILNCVREHGPISRAEVARLTGLTTGTVSNLCTGLLDRGLIEEVGLGASRGGRKPVMVRLSSSRFALGVQVGVDEVAVLLVSLACEPLRRRAEPLPPGAEPQAVVDQVTRLVGEVLAEAGVGPDRILGVGVSLPATVDADGEFVLYAPNLRWRSAPVGVLLRERLGLPVVLENDANAAAFGEFWCGATRGMPNSVFVYVDYGIGA